MLVIVLAPVSVHDAHEPHQRLRGVGVVGDDVEARVHHRAAAPAGIEAQGDGGRAAPLDLGLVASGRDALAAGHKEPPQLERVAAGVLDLQRALDRTRACRHVAKVDLGGRELHYGGLAPLLVAQVREVLFHVAHHAHLGSAARGCRRGVQRRGQHAQRVDVEPPQPGLGRAVVDRDDKEAARLDGVGHGVGRDGGRHVAAQAHEHGVGGGVVAAYVGIGGLALVDLAQRQVARAQAQRPHGKGVGVAHGLGRAYDLALDGEHRLARPPAGVDQHLLLKLARNVAGVVGERDAASVARLHHLVAVLGHSAAAVGLHAGDDHGRVARVHHAHGAGHGVELLLEGAEVVHLLYPRGHALPPCGRQPQRQRQHCHSAAQQLV